METVTRTLTKTVGSRWLGRLGLEILAEPWPPTATPGDLPPLPPTRIATREELRSLARSA